jgi:crotonobetainyl-CoA:carnitine CoA-transferase CaiB-like acyl-CoA transferase
MTELITTRGGSEPSPNGALTGIRVIEIGDIRGEYCGLVLAGLGADVIKVEPPGGSPTRTIGPFYQGVPSKDRSLHFWAFNRGKRSVVLDLGAQPDRDRLSEFIRSADVVLDSTPTIEVARTLGLTYEQVAVALPEVIVGRMTDFGDDGPWRDYRASDLVHLALGGVAMNCGYDPRPDGTYDLPPVAPQAFHSYQIAGEQLALGIVAALVHRTRSGLGQAVSCAIHEAVAKNTELDLMSWVFLRQPLRRQTARHAGVDVTKYWNTVHTADGRWVAVMTMGHRDSGALQPFLRGYGAHEEVELVPTRLAGGRPIPGSTGPDASIEIVQRFVRRFPFDAVPWQAAQEAGLLWAPIRKPHENLDDEHWRARGTFEWISHPELERSFAYPVRKWRSTGPSWVSGRRAPLLDEDAATVETPVRPPRTEPILRREPTQPSPVSRHHKPFVLDHIRVLDFTWFLASAGGTRFLAALGADCIKVEWKDNPDTRGAMFPIGGRDARAKATGPLRSNDDPDMGGQFNNKNPGKRGITLNVRHPKGLEMARELVRQSDVVAEGFSPGVMARWGLGYERMRDLNPSIIYAAQSGLGAHGTYGRFRTLGPLAAAFAGTTEMSGLPDPAPPAGWGYSYLDWFGAYSFGLSMLCAILHRERTGEGQYIDASQVEVGIFQTALQVLEWSADETIWTRTGNRSRYAVATPEGIYPCLGSDRWIAITCATDDEWRCLAALAQRPDWLTDPRFATAGQRRAHADELDREIDQWTCTLEPYAAMEMLQQAGIAAGVAQTAEDRCDHDPQLTALQWLTEVPGTKIGTWPVAELPVRLTETPAHIGGRWDRGAPCYGEHNYEVYSELLGLSPGEVDELAGEGVI